MMRMLNYWECLLAGMLPNHTDISAPDFARCRWREWSLLTCKTRRPVLTAIIFLVGFCHSLAIAEVDQPAKLPQAVQNTSQEEQAKAAMLYEFIAYVEWPAKTFASAISPYRIGVLQADRIGHSLKDIAQNSTTKNRQVEVVLLDQPTDTTSFHMLFIGNAAQDKLPMVTEQTTKRPVLVVTESEQWPVQGSMINLRPVGERIGFDVHLPCVEECQLKLSARLLAIAVSVIEGAP